MVQFGASVSFMSQWNRKTTSLFEPSIHATSTKSSLYLVSLTSGDIRKRCQGFGETTNTAFCVRNVLGPFRVVQLPN